MLGFRSIATKCKDRFSLLSNQVCNAYYHGWTAPDPHAIYVLSITLSPALAEIYSNLCLGVRNRKKFLYLVIKNNY